MKNKKINIRKSLMAIPYFLLWVLYVMLTLKNRNEYMMSEQRGYKCTGSKDTSRFMYGSVTTFYYDPTKKPERDYITWKQFWNARGY